MEIQYKLYLSMSWYKLQKLQNDIVKSLLLLMSLVNPGGYLHMLHGISIHLPRHLVHALVTVIVHDRVGEHQHLKGEKDFLK